MKLLWAHAGNRFFFLAMMTVAAATLLFCSGGDVAGTISETDAGIVGVIVSQSGTPAEGARVVAYVKDSAGLLIPADTVTTGSDGRYNFIGLPTALYLIEGEKLIDTVTYVALAGEFDFDSLLFADSALDAGTDTLLAPGAVRGVVRAAGGNHLGIEIWIPGTSFSARSDSSGQFVMSGIPEGSSYALMFSLDGFVAQQKTGVAVAAGDTTILSDTLLLSYDPDQTPPAPAGLVASFDSLTKSVVISWDTVAHPNLSGFVVYRRDSAQSAVEPLAISGLSLVNGIVFIDTLGGLDSGVSVTLLYQVKSQDGKGDRSGYSWPALIHVTIDWNTDSIPHDTTPDDTTGNDTTLTDTLGPQMVTIPGGSFVDEDGRNAGVSGFLMMETEVTVGMYRAFKPSYMNILGSNDSLHPVASVSWDDAIRYANWLSNKLGLDTCYILDPVKRKDADQTSSAKWPYDTLFYSVDTSADGYRLPTGDEWECAARGGQGYDYATDDGTMSASKSWTESYTTPSRVRLYPANPYGVYDMTGNVWELVWDDASARPAGRYNYIASADSANTYCVKRGDGFYGGTAGSARAVEYRTVWTGTFGYENDLGFRLVKKRN